jgi:hypothetical protein
MWADATGVLYTVDGPREEAMGRPWAAPGNTLTGMAAALVESGRPVPRPGVSRPWPTGWPERLAKPDPGSRISEIIAHIPAALRRPFPRRPQDRPPHHPDMTPGRWSTPHPATEPVFRSGVAAAGVCLL